LLPGSHKWISLRRRRRRYLFRCLSYEECED
jgi:hypothetical protein